ncbi:MAG TPA: flavodoxin domain-containing protein [Puia sp.]|jgi:sulfite reductase (NADPH) flavoprotein alpha-component|nr:flavodoxin domain-containing protein [Puia sp.]
MLTSPKMTLVRELITGASREELVWLSGYLAGIVAQRTGEATSSAALTLSSAPIAGPTAVLPAAATLVETPTTNPGSNAASPAIGKITIAYGTETGNSKKLATDFAARAKKKGINARLVGLEQYRLNDLPKEEYFFTVISTQGDGEPPAAAKKFYDHLHQGELRLDRMKYSVLALGDTAYPLFCKAGEDIDQQLQKIGGQRIASLQKCDTDYETEAGHWFDSILQQLDTDHRPAALTDPAIATSASAAAAFISPAPPRNSGKRIHTGTVLTNINLNDRGSGKRTHHLEIAAEGVSYQPGDSIGIVPENPIWMVEAIVSLAGIDPAHKLFHQTTERSVSEWLKQRLNIVYLPERVVKKYAAIVRQEIPQTKIGLLDLLKIYPVKNSKQFQEVIAILEPTAPRLYSISSSPEAHSGEIHLTVARDTFSVNGEWKYGLCSDGLSQLIPGQTVEFYIHHNSQFRLPAPEKDIIMIGPGTGIAPFRSFLAERDSTGAPGKNWLFFGDQHFTTDFLYQTEIQDWSRTGVLTRINTAFSRDQAQKVYVQHRMRQQAAGLFQWLESGAHLYLCGAKDPMSADVENTLLDIIRTEGNRSSARAESYLDDLKATGRYAKDVY